MQLLWCVRIETFPLILGILVGLLGLGFIADAWFVRDSLPGEDRRRRVRAERHKGGEALLGLGFLCLAAALFGRDTSRYSNVAVIAGTIAVILGAISNRAYLRELLFFRGASRRGMEAGTPGESGKYRIR